MATLKVTKQKKNKLLQKFLSAMMKSPLKKLGKPALIKTIKLKRVTIKKK